jgi:hypothetical protein
MNDQSDITVSKDSSLTILTATREYMRQAKDAKATRQKKNDQNTDLYLGNQDFSHKTAGQSAEFLPLLPIAVERISAFVKRALVDFGDWFSVDVADNQVLTDNQVREIILSQLNTRSRVDATGLDFATMISDAVKTGILQSLMVFKVYGKHYYSKKFQVERGESIVKTEAGPVRKLDYTVSEKEKKEWCLCIDLVNPDDYFTDPTGRGLFKIHRVRRDLHEVVAMCDTDNPIYDLDVVEQILGDFAETDRAYREAHKANQDMATPPDFRKEVVIDECWGNILDEDGNVVHENVVWAVANEKYLIRKPEPNPWWHGHSPFIETPLIRVPFSTWHKALADLAGPLNIAANELFGLMLDGAFTAVHGIKQIRMDYVERPEDLSGGIAPGQTIVIKAETPPGLKVIERVDQGSVPQDAMAMYGVLVDQFQTSMQTNDVQMGQIPNKEVRATEIVQAENSTNGFFDGIVRDIETHGISRVLWLAWMVIIQEMDDMPLRHIKNPGTRAALNQLATMTAQERFVLLANDISFEVRGLSGTMQRSKDFQKFMGLMSSVSTMPMLMQAFFNKYSPEKALEQLFKYLNFNPSSMEMTQEERATMQQRMEQMQQMSQVAGGGTSGRGEAGGASEEAQINKSMDAKQSFAGGVA